MDKVNLDGKWLLRTQGVKNTSRHWIEAEVPGCVHLDLMKEKIIPDPFYRMNEKEVCWVERRDWEYVKKFNLDRQFLGHEKIELVFSGIDTFSCIELNGRRIGQTENMFIPYRFSVKNLLKQGKNILKVKIASPTRTLEKIEKRHRRFTAAFYPPRVYGRKAQYSFGWDWGPRLPTSGIWKNVELIAWNEARLENVGVNLLSLDKEKALLAVTAEVESLKETDLDLQMDVFLCNTAEKINKVSIDGKFFIYKLRPGYNCVPGVLEIKNPQVWWPNGYGEQPLYNLRVRLKKDDTILGEKQESIGLRKLRLVQKKDGEGRIFVFEVNDTPIFMKGANWIPLDSFIPRIKKKDYEKIITLAQKAQMNMFRVWGGGIYERDEFYRLCNERGILIWQDFMFSCGEYPEINWFWKLVEEEARYIVKRLRNHPCLALWSGNNENEAYRKFNHKKRKGEPQLFGQTIYFKILPRICKALDPSRPYRPSSPYPHKPYSKECPYNSNISSGDRHAWEMWGWGKGCDYEDISGDKSRFVSEFGFQGPPNLKTIYSFTSLEDRAPLSEVMEFHNKGAGTGKIYQSLILHFPVSGKLEEFVFFAQVNQGEVLRHCLEHWRRRKFKTSGALIWQINDCWPVISWALIDYRQEPKLAYYFTKKAFRPVLVSFSCEKEKISLWITNDLLREVKGDLLLEVRRFSPSRKSIKDFSPMGKAIYKEKIKIEIEPNVSRKIKDIEIKKIPLQDKTRQFLFVSLFEGKNLLSDNYLFLKQPKHLHVSPQELKNFYITFLKFLP